VDHLDLVAGMFEELGIAEVIDHATQQDPAMRIVTAGHAVKAMVLNGLGFLNQQLYLVPHFFQVSFSDVAFSNYVGFPSCCSRLLVTLFTTTPHQCASFLPEEAVTDRHSQVLSGERDPRLQVVTTRETADEGSLGTRLLNATSEEIEAYFCK
jgi:Domain of unknown function (DUF4277)